MPSPAQPPQPRLHRCLCRALPLPCVSAGPLPPTAPFQNTNSVLGCPGLVRWPLLTSPAASCLFLPRLPPSLQQSPGLQPSPCSSRLRFCLCSHILVSLVSFLFFFFLTYSTCPLRLIHTWPLHCMEVSELVIFSPIFLAFFFYFHYEVCHLLLPLFEHLAV